MIKSAYKVFRQLDHMDCGPTCLKMITSFYGKDYPIDFFRVNSNITRTGVSLLNLSVAAEKIGFRSLMVKIHYKSLVEDAPLPCILHWNQEHYVVLYDIIEKNVFFKKKRLYVIADPGHGIIKLEEELFLKCWTGDSLDKKGVALLLETSPDFYKVETEKEPKTKGFKFLYQYIRPYKAYVYQLALGMVLSSVLSLIFPFLTQSLVDYGIQQHNLTYIYIVLFSQLLIFLGNISIDLIRNWVLLHVNTRISVSIISNFLSKMMNLPISFFERKNVGDISQRINDHHRIENFLTGSSLQTFFSLINIVVFSFVLSAYGLKLFAVFFIGSILSVGWIFLFLNKRKELDYKRFQRLRDNQNGVYELITGMQEIKLNNCERTRRWDWERIQAKLFKLNIKSLALEQYQEVGSSFLTQLKNILITFIAAQQVIDNRISLGTMLSISYIIGQLNGPLSQIIDFIRSVQDAKMSLDRLSEIHNVTNEDSLEQETSSEDYHHLFNKISFDSDINEHTHKLLNENSKNTGIVVDNISFGYGGSKVKNVINNLSLIIPKGKVTAIVGSSGSGKTTLMKILLKFYTLPEGEIFVNGLSLNDIPSSSWRKMCGTVMQDGYIFSDTILRNIAVDGSKVDEEKLRYAISTANIQDYIRKLPLGLSTKIGSSGHGLSGGQRQRILIARAVYKNPQYMFFDEATSALDANNERTIIDNLNEFFEGRTVVVVAHRLSTVKNADQIVVMHNGSIAEVGTHQQLTRNKGLYYELVKNQLELESN